MGGSGGPAPNYQGAAEQQAYSTFAMNHPNTSNPFSSTTWNVNPSPTAGGFSINAPSYAGDPAPGNVPQAGVAAQLPPISPISGGTGTGNGVPGGGPGGPGRGGANSILYSNAMGGSPQNAAQGSGPQTASQFSSQTTLSPELQEAMNAMVAQLRGGAGGGGAADAAYNQATSRLDPMWNQRQNDLNAQLAAQGLDPSSQAYQAQMGNFDRGRNDAYSSAQNNAFGQGLDAFKTNMAGLGGLYSFLQGPSYATGQGPDYLGAAQYLGNYNLGQASQANQAAGQGIGAVGSAVGAMAPFILSAASSAA